MLSDMSRLTLSNLSAVSAPSTNHARRTEKILGRRESRRTPHQPNASLSRSEVASPTAALFRSLLELPIEIRLQIYGYFVAFPASISKSIIHPPAPRHVTRYYTLEDEERVEILTTRYSLQLDCRQIRDEWSPLFYSTTTIVADGVSRGRYRDRGATWSANRRPVEFQCGFLEAFTPDLINTIRKIDLDASWCRMFSHGFQVLTLKDFLVMLRKHRSNLISLEEVTLSSKVNRGGLWNIKKDERHLAGPLLRAYPGESLLDPDIIDILFVSKEQGPTFNDWTPARRVHFRKWEPLLGHALMSVTIDRVQVVLRKPGLPDIADTESWIEIKN